MSIQGRVSEFWQHFAIGNWHRVLDQDRVAGEVTFLDAFPPDRDGAESRYFRVTCKVLRSEEFVPKPEVER
jgi:hypothetical protein